MATGQPGTLLGHIQQLAARRDTHGTDRQLLAEFAEQRNEAAFASLVARHGPMVLRICRRVLQHDQDAEDAFQATFLVLATNLRSIRKREALAGWLYGVAYRTAMKARRSAVRRRNHQARLQERRRADLQSAAPSWDDVQVALDEEIQALPPPHRAAFVLCAMEGKTVPEAAAELGVKVGTLSSHLTRARQRLQRRLAKRGIELTALLAALSLANGSGKAAVPGALAQPTVRLGLLAAAGASATGVIPSHIAALAAGVTRAMFLTKAKILMVVLLALGLVPAAAGLLAHQVLAAKETAFAQRNSEAGDRKSEVGDPKPAVPEEKSERVEISGSVIDPAGKPVAGARLFLCDQAGKSPASQPATTANGRFHLKLPSLADREPRFLLAMADGLGLDWVDLRLIEPGEDVVLRLPVDVPIRGKVVDLEGKPVGGAAIRIVSLSTTASGNLDLFLRVWAQDKEKAATGPAFYLLREKLFWSHKALGQLDGATTGPDGSFRLTGVGRDRSLMLRIRGPAIADHYVRILTRPGFSFRPASQAQVALFGPELAVSVVPSKPIQGTVRDAQTKQPLAGIRVQGYTPDWPIDWEWKGIETMTDAQGRYRLNGLPKSARHIVAFDPGAGASYVHRFDDVADTQGFMPIVHDTELYRGIVVEGQVTDASTGRPVRALVRYAPLANNPYFTNTPGYDRPRSRVTLWGSYEVITLADGHYRLTALPGPGVLVVQVMPGAGRYTQAAIRKEDLSATYNRQGQSFMTRGAPSAFFMSHLNAYRLIRPAAGASDLTVNFGLDQGLRQRGRLVDADGRPLSGAEVFNLSPLSAWKVVLPGDEFTVEAVSSARPRRLLFWHHERKLAGTIVLRGNETDPITVTMKPLAAITGRALATNGEPLVGYAVGYSALPDVEWPRPEKPAKQPSILTDNQGRFHIPDLPTGLPLGVYIVQPKTSYALIHRDNIILEAGKTRDLGDLRGQPRDDAPQVDSGSVLPKACQEALASNVQALKTVGIRFSVQPTYATVQRLGGRPEHENAHLYLDNGRFHLWREMTFSSPSGGQDQLQKEEMSFDGSTFYLGNKSHVLKLLGANPGDPKAKDIYLPSPYFDAVGFGLPETAAQWKENPATVSTVLQLVSTGKVMGVSTDGPTLKLTLKIPEPYVEKARKLDLDAMAKGNPLNSAQFVAAYLRVRELDWYRQVELWLDPEKGYAIKRRKDSNPEGKLIQSIDCDDFRYMRRGKLWLPWKCTVKSYLESPPFLKGFRNNPQRIDEIEVQDLTFEPRADVSFSLDYGIGTRVND
jgi:RNA polymerase sigma factor (sigma-70 family)